MSVRVMSLVWELELPDSEKIVLLALADCANDEGHCWPGMNSLVRKCSKSDRTIQAAIQTLCVKGHLTRREVLGKGCNYTVHPIVRFASDTPEAASPRSGFPPKPAAQTPEAVSGKPSRTIKTEAKASYKVIIDRWNERAKGSGIPPVRVLNHSRQQMINARIKEHGLDEMLRAVDNVHNSPFCRGEQGDGRKADIMLILQPKTLPRVLEGFYGADESKVELGPAERIAQLKRMIPKWIEWGDQGSVDRARQMIVEIESTNPMAAQTATLLGQIGQAA